MFYRMNKEEFVERIMTDLAKRRINRKEVSLTDYDDEDDEFIQELDLLIQGNSEKQEIAVKEQVSIKKKDIKPKEKLEAINLISVPLNGFDQLAWFF